MYTGACQDGLIKKVIIHLTMVRYRTIMIAQYHISYLEALMDSREIMARLNSAMRRVDASYAAIGRKYGLTYNALMMVYLIDGAESITQKQLCDALQLPKSTVHSILRELLKNNYVRLVEGVNRKEKQIVVNAPGDALFTKIRNETEQIEMNVLRSFGDLACTAFLASAERLACLLQAETAREYGGEDASDER